MLFLMTSESAKAIADYILGQLRYESATTRKVLAAVPDQNLDYKPSEKCTPGLALAAHIAAAEAFFLQGVIDGGFNWKQPDTKTPAEVVKFYDETIPGLLDQVAALPGEKLVQPLKFAGFELPAVEYLTISLKHGIHHRGQLSSYLRPMGGKVPSIYGPSADETVGASA
jgi:uncharacterized damage-inducible protein DinB